MLELNINDIDVYSKVLEYYYKRMIEYLNSCGIHSFRETLDTMKVKIEKNIEEEIK